MILSAELNPTLLRIIAILTFLSITSCTSSPPVTDEMKRQGIEWCDGSEFKTIGGKMCFIDSKKDDMKILNDITISDLRIRHTRAVKGKYFIDCDEGELEILELSGPFNSFTSKTIEKMLSDVRTCKKNQDENLRVIHLSSGGGKLIDGMEVGRLIRENNFRTFIPNNAICASSCAIAFLGGVYRSVGFESKVLLHAPYIEEKISYEEIYFRKMLQMENIGIVCASDMKELKDYFIEMLGEENGNFLYEQTMNFCSTNDGWVFNVDAAKLYGIDNGESYKDNLQKYFDQNE
jgi:hypothetical protein